MNTNGSGLGADGAPYTVDKVGVKAGSHAQRLREHGLLIRANTVQAFAEVQKGDFEPRLVCVESLYFTVARCIQRIPDKS